MIFQAPDEFDLDVRLLAANHGGGHHRGGQGHPDDHGPKTQHGPTCAATCSDTCQDRTCNHAHTCDCFSTDAKSGCGMGPATSAATCPAGCNA